MDDSSALVSCPSWALIPSTTSRNFFFSKLNITCKHKVFHFCLFFVFLAIRGVFVDINAMNWPCATFHHCTFLGWRSSVCPQKAWSCPSTCIKQDEIALLWLQQRTACLHAIESWLQERNAVCGEPKKEINTAFELVNSNKYTSHLLILHVRIYTYAWLCIRLFTYLGCRTCRGRL